MLYIDFHRNKNTQINKTFFRLYIMTPLRTEYERCIAVCKYIVDKEFVPKENKSLDYFKIRATVDNIVSLNVGLSEEPSVKLKVSNEYASTYQNLYNQSQNEIALYNKELGIIKTLHTCQTSSKTPTIKNFIFPKLQPRKHQLVMMAMSILVRRSAYLVQMGLGKTAPAIHTFAYRKQKGEVKKCIVFCPKTICFKWAEEHKNEIEKHSNLKGIVLYGDRNKRAEIINKFATSDIDFMVTSYSFWSGRNIHTEYEDEHGNKGVTTINKNEDEFQLIKNIKPEMFILDESHYIKNMTSNVSRNVTRFCESIPYGILLTGSPTPNNLYDIFSQYNLLDSRIFGKEYHRFITKYFDQYVDKFEVKVDKKDELVAKIHSKAITYKSEDCIDLPKRVYNYIDIKMTDDYINNLTEVDERDLGKMENDKFLFNPALIKLLISCSGYNYNESGDGVRYKNTPKLDALRELLESLVINEGKKVVIWYNFRYDIIILEELFTEMGIEFISINRAVDKESRDRIKKIFEFETNDKIKILLGSPKLISEGIDIYSTNYNIEWNVDFRFDKLDQAEARTRRMESKFDHVFYYRLRMLDTIEEIVYRALSRKESYKTMIFGIQEYIKKARIKYVG